MKHKTITLLITLALCLSASARKGILVAQFGTSNAEGRHAALDVLFGEIASENPQYTVREAYTSPTIRRALQKQGTKKQSVTDALLQMHLDGIDTVYIQPTFLLDGVEMQMLREEASDVSRFFSYVQVGVPLLYEIEDFRNLTSLLVKTKPNTRSAIIYVGHGNEYASTSAYAMLGQMLSHEQPDAYIGTIEGWPDIETSVAQLKGRKYRQVTLIPLLLACGVHAHEDIDEEWRPALEELGLKVDVLFQGLGESAEIRALIKNHLASLLAE